MFRILLVSIITLSIVAGCSSSKNKKNQEKKWGYSEFDERSGDHSSSKRKPASNEGLNLDEEIEYEVKKGDTLMQISFKLYGDYSQWRAIEELNGGFSNGLMAGKVIKAYKPKEPFVWEPSGLPYVIQEGDTLGKISIDKYGTPKKWKNIYENNQPLIKDPNRIYAGFTIFYQEADELAEVF